VHEEVLSWLRPMIDNLPDRYRGPLYLAEVEGRSQQHVADVLGLSLSGAKSRVQRARARLGALVQRGCEVEFGPGGRAEAFRRLGPGFDLCEAAGCA
jgi:RNA polymerase sigma-70 factor (ECF subfamily)